MRKSLKKFGLTVITCSLSACSDSVLDENVFYGDLNEAQQAKYMTELVAEFNTEVEAFRTRVNLSETITEIIVTGDTETGILTNIGTYEKVLTPEKLEEARARLEKVKSAQYDVCYQPEMRALNKRGIGFQNILKSPNGDVLYEGPLCEGDTFVPRPYVEQTEAQQAITLAKIAKRFEDRARSENLDPKSIYESTLTSNPAEDTIYGELAFTEMLSPEYSKQVKAELDILTKDPNACLGDEIQDLNESGISYEYRVVDYLGNNIVKPTICPATNTVALSPIPKLRGQTASR